MLFVIGSTATNRGKSNVEEASPEIQGLPDCQSVITVPLAPVR
jgi:hypothetical protein